MTHILYILARNDMDSMNPGKLGAQCSHASNAFRFENDYDPKDMTDADHLIREWEVTSPQGFGTVITLAVNEAQMRTAATIMQQLGYMANVVHDETYPVRDGAVTHFIPVDTCAYVFVPDKEDDLMASAVLGKFELYP